MTVDLSTVPLVALSSEAKQVISILLNPPKVIPSENGLPRDWRGLAHLCKISGECMPLLTSHADPLVHILSLWEKKRKDITLKDLRTILEEIERWDILDDTVELFERDAKKYLEELQKAQTSAEIIVNEIDQTVLTVGDLHRFRQGSEENQRYDAFLLYADEDVKFASEMVDKLENQYGLKLCLKDRDLIGGVTFEHEAIMTLISERCNRLIVVISPNFLKSSANKFFLNYAQALSIDKKQRKIVPCLYQRCQLPQQLNYMFILDYNRAGHGMYDFWGKLRDSVEVPTATTRTVKNSKVSLVKGDECCRRNEEVDNDEKNENKMEKENTKRRTELSVEPERESGSNDGIDSDKSKKAENNAHHSNFVASNHNHDTLNQNNKKYGNFLQWSKKKYFTKAEGVKKDDTPSPLTGTISLPSLENIDSLSDNTSSLIVESIEKKHKMRFINKYVQKKKVQLKKVLVES